VHEQDRLVQRDERLVGGQRVHAHFGVVGIGRGGGVGDEACAAAGFLLRLVGPPDVLAVLPAQGLDKIARFVAGGLDQFAEGHTNSEAFT
jgi:hypothetical protein